MAEPIYVDWDGLVYYDWQVKEYISEELEVCIKMGGHISFSELPDPSVNNLNYVYKITDEFVTTSDFKDKNIAYPANTWVQCTEFNNVFLYTIFNESSKIDELENYYTKIELDTQLKNYALVEDIPIVPTKVSELENDAGYAKTDDIPDTSSFITMQDVEDKGYLTEVPSEYITEDELDSKGYLTEHQSLEGLATEEYVNKAIEKIPQVDTTNLVTTTQLEAALGDKANDVLFTDNLVVGNALGGFAVGDSVQGLTLVTLFTRLLGLTAYVEPEGIISKIISDAYPIYTGTSSSNQTQSTFQVLSASSGAFDGSGNPLVGFYTNDTNTEAGYQMQLPAGDDGDPMTFMIPEYTTLKAVYQWDTISSSWILSDINYFRISGSEEVVVEGKHILYNKYEWNEEEYGGTIYMPSNWRFEIEVNDVAN